MKFYNQILTAAAEQVKTSVNAHLPDGAQKNFMLWALANDNPNKNDYLRMLGVNASATLGIALLSKSLDAVTLKKLINAEALLCVYAGFEGSSDNIGFGLANRKQKRDQTYEIKKKVLINFYDTMLMKLKGDVNRTHTLLLPFASDIKIISAYQHSLHPDEFRQLAKRYQELDKTVSLRELDHSVLATLILNVAACLKLNKEIETHPLATYLKDGLIDRYTLVKSQIIDNNPKDLSSLIELGTKTILIMQMLAFSVGSLDIISPNPKLLATLNDGSLQQAFYSAALLVRLLNDFGTQLLKLSSKDQTAFFNDLKHDLLLSKTNSIYKFLYDFSEKKQYSALLTRIRKDIALQEFNISLDRLTAITSPEIALEQFSQDIRFCSELYQKNYKALIKELATLKQRLGDEKISNIIANFVLFHEKIYAEDYENPQGDYMFYGSNNPP